MSDAPFGATAGENAAPPNGWTERERQALQALLGLNRDEVEELLLWIVSARATLTPVANAESGCSPGSGRWVVE